MRDFDLVLVGGTGFVGRLTAAQLAERTSPGLRVGLAGRSPERLEQLRAELPAAARDWPLLSTDIGDEGAAAELAGRSRVIVTTAGPYLRYGLPLVTACAEAGTHYADLTGETLFVRRSIDAAHESARRSGAKLVHSCGFDSVPSDLGVGLAAALAEGDGAGTLTDAVLHVRSARGGISGGTIDSMRQQILQVQKDPAARALVSDPYALVDDPSGRPYAAGGRSSSPLARDDPAASWQAPFIMGGFNRQIVHRSNALVGWPYGREFGYREVVDTGAGVPGLVRAAGVFVGTGALMGGMWLPPTRFLLDRVLPAPGRGPTEKTLRDGRFAVEVLARTANASSYRTTVAAPLDPGYGGTAVMLAESALALVEDDLDDRAGVLTPMVALGEHLAARLRVRGFSVSANREE